MLIEADDVGRDDVLRAPVVIVGAGAAGMTLARSLASSGVDVLLLESGGFSPDPEVQALYEGDVVGHQYSELDVTRLREVGGTTQHWHGWCRPLDPIDLERREWVPDSGWPISHDELARWYPEAHEILQLGPVDFDASSWASRHDLGTFNDGQDVDHTVFQFSPPTRFRETYGDELVASPRVRLVIGANVTDVMATDDGSRVDHLEVRTLAGNTFTVEGKLVVLAAGALEIVRLLLVSDAVHTNGLGNRNDLVGRYFAEHPHLFMPALLDLPPQERRFFDLHELDEAKILGVLNLTDEARRRDGLLGWTGEFWDGPDRDPEGVEVLWFGISGRRPPAATARLTLRCEQAPNPDSRVVLTDKRDTLGLRQIALDWRFTDLDHASAEASLRLLARHLGARGHGTVRLHHDEGPSWLERARPGNHQLGVARMAIDAKHGVVDGDGRVHDVGNLFIAGGAVFPTGGHANPTLTIVALSLRLADLLRREAAA